MTLFIVLICIRHNRNNNEIKKNTLMLLTWMEENRYVHILSKNLLSFFCMFRLIPINLLVSLSHFLFWYHRIYTKCQSHINWKDWKVMAHLSGKAHHNNSLMGLSKIFNRAKLSIHSTDISNFIQWNICFSIIFLPASTSVYVCYDISMDIVFYWHRFDLTIYLLYT